MEERLTEMQRGPYPGVRRTARRAWLPVAALAVSLSLACMGRVQAAEEASGEASFSTLRDNGINYYKKKLYLQALLSLEKAAAVPEGEKDFRTQLYLARSAYQEVVLEKAFPAATRAMQLAEESRDPDNIEKARSLVEELSSSFAGVTFRKDPDQKTELKETYIFLKDVEGLINVQKKKVFTQIRDRFLKARVKLPITLYLPFGKYTANGAPFEVKKGEMAESKLFMYLEEPGGIAWYWYAGAAALVAGGTAVALVLLLGGEEEEQQAVRFDTMSVFSEP